MNAAPFFVRVFHQCRTEWRHQAGLAALWLLVLVLRQWDHAYEVKAVFSRLSIANLGLWLEAATAMLAAALTWRCVSADAPSNTDTFSLTRPVGQQALWCGKLLFLLGAVILPATIVVGTGWLGFGLGSTQWLAMTGAVMLTGALVCGIAGALTTLAATSRQVIALAVLTVIGAGVWLAMQERYAEPAKITLEQHHLELCGSLVAALVALAGLLAAWWTGTVPRRRWLAACGLIATLAAAPLIAHAWRTNWITPTPLSYANASKLNLQVGKAEPDDKTPGRRLWPTLRVTGLGKDEVVSIIEFAPLNEGAPWPPEGSYSDLTPNNRGGDAWLHSDHTRALFKHYEPAVLWRQQISNDTLYDGRKSLDAVLQTLRLQREEAITRPWRLRLVVHEMKRVATLPFRQFWTQENEFLIRPGLRLEFNAYVWLRDAWEMHGRAHRLSSAVLSVDSHRHPHVRGRDLSDNFFLVLEDQYLQENDALPLPLVQRAGRYASYRDHSRYWQTNENQGFEIRLWMPREQEVLLQRTLNEWIDGQNASLWHAEERGTVEFELSPEQMAQVLPAPAEKEAQRP